MSVFGDVFGGSKRHHTFNINMCIIPLVKAVSHTSTVGQEENIPGEDVWIVRNNPMVVG